MPKVDIAKVPVRSGTFYPAEFQAECAGRHKQALGDVIGLTQFGANITRPRYAIGTSRKTSSFLCWKASWS
jgi:uncharacterized cupin superfamily protein